MPFGLISEANQKWKAEGDLPIAASGDGQSIRVGDDIYVLAGGASCKLLARLSVLEVTLDTFRHRIDLKIGGPRSAVFFDSAANAISFNLSDITIAPLRYEVSCLDVESVQQLTSACGSHDFSSSTPVLWDAIAHQVMTYVSRANRDGDPRPELEIAESFLRRSYVTSQLPGPAPVYQNAARLALGIGRQPAPSQLHRRHDLTDEAIQKAINEDVATSGHTPNTHRHQEILTLLKNRLNQLGLSPKYNGLVDCIVEGDKFDVYFEVKSTSPESVVHQIRLALGQVLHYIWMDSEENSKIIRGHIVIEGPWNTDQESLRTFLDSNSIRLTWSQDISSMQIGDL